jgi:hypothetical protein
MDRSGTRRERSRRESAVVRRLRRVSLWSALAGVVAFAAVYKGIEAALGQRIKERFERQPDLRLAIARDDEFVDKVESSIPQPWPIDADRIVANEVQRLQEQAVAIETLDRKGPTALLLATDVFARRPTDADYERAREQFAEKLEEHEQALRSWLAGYRDAAERRARTFELSLSVISAKSGAYAEDVVLTLELPEGVEVVEEWPTVPLPPEPPAYIAPRPRSRLEVARPAYAGIDYRATIEPGAFVSAPRISFWHSQSDGRCVSIRLGNIHHDSAIELDERLLLRVPAAGHHALTWELRTKNGRRHCRGTLELVVPPAEERPPFTRLHGIKSYPDVPFVDDDAQVVCEARTSDPPNQPPPGSTAAQPLARMRDTIANRDWLALGLGDDSANPAGDEMDLALDLLHDATGEGHKA